MSKASASELISKLRNRVDADYQGALRLIGAVEKHLRLHGDGLEDDLVAYLAAIVLEQSSERSLREMVFSAIKDDFKSVAEIAIETNLPESKVRGVLYRPDILGKPPKPKPKTGSDKTAEAVEKKAASTFPARQPLVDIDTTFGLKRFRVRKPR